MATKKSDKKAKPISDVEKPGKSAASATSRPVIVTNRPIIKDPMVVEEQKEDAVPELPVKKTSTKPKLQPLAASPELDTTPAEPEPEQPAEPTETPKAAEENTDASKKSEKSVEETEDAAAQRKAEHDANLQKIVDAKTYYLPINTVEKHKTKRFIILGVLLSILLILVWIDIALDAELVQIDGIAPITHFF